MDLWGSCPQSGVLVALSSVESGFAKYLDVESDTSLTPRIRNKKKGDPARDRPFPGVTGPPARSP